jgi:hypothetical protein
MNEKFELAENITKLSDLSEVWKIVKENKFVSEVLEFDIELLPNRVGRNLYNYVSEKMGNAVKETYQDID